MFPNITWHALEKERVDRGIQEVRRQLPNMFINSGNCDELIVCFNNYEYKRLEAQDDWSAKPKHTKHSHMMDALRYAVMAINEIQYLGLDYDGTRNVQDSYSGFEDIEERASTFRKREKKVDESTYYL